MRFPVELQNCLNRLRAASPAIKDQQDPAEEFALLPDVGEWCTELRKVAAQVEKELTCISHHARQHPSFLFHASAAYPPEIRTLRIKALCNLKSWYRSLSLSDRVDAERYVRREIGFPVFPSSVRELQRLFRANPDIRVVRGAENVSFMLAEQRVVKVTQSRHEGDFYSIINLAKNMNVLYHYLDFEDADAQIEVSGRDMFFGEFPSGMNRLIVQPYVRAPGIGALTETQQHRPSFSYSWNTFADRLSAMRQEQCVTLDLTNSSAGMRPSRGNVWDTHNVMVDLYSDPTTFHVIDPDVFDLGDVKFSPVEYLRPDRRRRYGLVSSFAHSIRMYFVNLARQSFVLPWQEERFAHFSETIQKSA